MFERQGKSPDDVSLDELLAINDEIAAITRAGVPLEPALAALAEDMPGNLGKVTATLAERCSRGDSLSDVMSDKSVNLPPVYRAVVEAGIKTRRLPDVLESLSAAVHRLAEIRRSIAVAMMYPMLLVAGAWLLAAFLTSTVAPTMLEALEELGVGGTGGLQWLVAVGRSARYWGPVMPILLLIAAVAWRVRSRKAANMQWRGGGIALAWVPWMKTMCGCTRQAAFAEIFALLIESDVPMDESLLLAADASGDADIRESAGKIAGQLRAGRPPGPMDGAGGLPPMLRWLMSNGTRRDVMLPAVRRAAESYRQRAMHQAAVMRVFLPVAMTVVIGGSAALFYTLMLWIPYAAAIESMGNMYR